MDNFYSLGFLVSRASVALSKSLNVALESHNIDLSHSQFIVLRCLYFKNNLSQLEIANLLFKDAAAIKRTIDLLEKKGFVVRKQVRTLKNSVCITVKGKRIMPQILKIADNEINNALKGIEPENQLLLHAMLEKIYTNLEKNK